MKRTGELLKKAREEKGLSLIEIGLSLKINTKILKAIEDGDQDQLPAKTFLRGFVKSYATFLRLDSDEVLKVFHEEMGSTSPKPLLRGDAAKTGDAEEPSEDEEDQALSHEISRADKMAPLNEKKNTRLIAISLVVLALFGLIVFTKKMIDKYSKEAEVPIVEVNETIEDLVAETQGDELSEAEAESDAESEVATEATAAEIPEAPMSKTEPKAEKSPETKTETAANESAKKETPPSESAAAVTAKPTPAAQTVAPPAATPTPVVKAETPLPSPMPPTAEAVPTPAPTPTPTPVAAEPAPETPAADERPKNVELIVEALDAVNIEYSAPNGKPQRIKLAVDQVHTFKSKSGLKINFSNGGAVNLILNGRELGIPGDLGKPINLSY